MKQKIIQTALKICEKDGYESFSMRKLATKLNLDPMAIYHYFENKEALTKAMVEQIFNRLQKQILTKNKNPRLTIKRILVDYWCLFLDYPGMSLYLIKNSYEEFPSVVSFNKILQDLFNILYPGINSEKILHIVIDFIHGNALAFSMIPKDRSRALKPLPNQKEFESSLLYLLDQFLPF
ncbi:TetR/AcrR family transcriptional regulator [Leptospira congkakensis]|uniref:TetR/AcrR family transcriptional regulator n=1 Tax=Leptospira congkakensis TaxID=2484932 RepID=A0A4Z1A8N4_9LEPT|nr:TetR/AcrR family transcriptional regulator [Leptospira congkakensis]TGL85277.1 TetR/AcrR family transcriptional regulator [Leptospira congkakensis]TGL85372.1 TetR/AcrR family transcriptional regulator [Leptospira congkakensis]TGL99884.1 TetR/AcrR family transcriptional regulator [Leptospira congkakensis]